MHELRLDHPRQALDAAGLQHVLDELAVAGGQPVLLTGRPDAFCTGWDHAELLALDQANLPALLLRFEAALEALWSYAGPTVAWMSGPAIGPGYLLALACDYRLAAEADAAHLGLNETALGLSLPPAALELAKRRLPPQRWDEVVLAGKLIPPGAALWLGLVDEVVPNDRGATARQRLAHLAAHPSRTYARTKARLRAPLRDADAWQAFVDEDLQDWWQPEVRRTLRGLA